MNGNYFILTGAMGSGKSTTLKELHKKGFICVDEPARRVLAEQRNIHGSGVPEQDSNLFCQLLLSRSINLYEQHSVSTDPVIFDRGIPDCITYADFFEHNTRPFINASNQYRYSKDMFFLSAWEDIYHVDSVRKMSFEQARQFGDDVRKAYVDLGYNLIDVPFGPPEFRAKFISEAIASQKK